MDGNFPCPVSAAHIRTSLNFERKKTCLGSFTSRSRLMIWTRQPSFMRDVFGFRQTGTGYARGHVSRHLTDGNIDLALMVYDSEDVEEARLSVPGPCIHHWASKSRIAAHLRETDCVAGHVRLELRNVVANYPFERSHRFAGIQPNSGFGDYSRLSCGIEGWAAPCSQT